ncbi:MAG: glutamyl-tRNA reductase [Candidatus Omnitrophica bacterium]|nr:glutamyl-tRNA reductase [Candidatus Omnitrophota bacterium]
MFVIGLNHKTAPISIREKFYLNPQQQDLFLTTLKDHPLVSECFVLSTCNRVEVYLKKGDACLDSAFIMDMIARVKKIHLDFDHTPYIYVHESRRACEHLFKVACGLDSLVLGERQILGQVKMAVDRARQIGTLSRYFNILTNIAVRAGKKAHHETAIGHGGSSISWAAIEMAQGMLGSLSGKSALVIGAGKMGEMALTHLCRKGLAKMYLMNRTGEKAGALAVQYNGIAASFFDIKEILSEVDLCICSVGAPHYILDKEQIVKVMAARSNRPLLFIDISMPRNIDPAVAQVPGAHLCSIDDLDQVVDAGMKKRAQAMAEVEGIIRRKILEFDAKIAKLKALKSSDFFDPAKTQ